PLVAMRPGQSQQWRIANISANAYLDLELEGHQLHVIGLDGNPVETSVAYDHIQMGPGERVQAVVQAIETGTYRLKSRAWGALGQAQPEFTVATIEVAGDAMEPEPIPGKIIDIADYAEAEIAAQRIITFQEGYDKLPFSIDDVAFNMDVVNTTVKLGTIEEWILRNTSADWHPFHIHVDDFQVMTVNGAPFPYVNRQDTVSLPTHGSVVVRIAFTDFPGKFVYHCHILSHEDFGMMAVIEVVT
ncbi:MAG: multicopper oxidase family protein, partial [Thermomicrobiales bacterium]